MPNPFKYIMQWSQYTVQILEKVGKLLISVHENRVSHEWRRITEIFELNIYIYILSRLRTAHALKLRDLDRQRWFHMCQWLTSLSDDQLKSIAFSDEATFCMGNASENSANRCANAGVTDRLIMPVNKGIGYSNKLMIEVYRIQKV